MAEFVNIGGLWKAKPGAKTALSGSMYADALEEALGKVKGKTIRVFVKKNDRKQSDNSPDYQLTAVFDSEEDGYKKRGERNGRDNRAPREERVYRPSRHDEKKPQDSDDEVPF